MLISNIVFKECGFLGILVGVYVKLYSIYSRCLFVLGADEYASTRETELQVLLDIPWYMILLSITCVWPRLPENSYHPDVPLLKTERPTSLIGSSCYNFHTPSFLGCGNVKYQNSKSCVGSTPNMLLFGVLGLKPAPVYPALVQI